MASMEGGGLVGASSEGNSKSTAGPRSKLNQGWIPVAILGQGLELTSVAQAPSGQHSEGSDVSWLELGRVSELEVRCREED
eukprot:2889323-Rhodomonas_salina.1